MACDQRRFSTATTTRSEFSIERIESATINIVIGFERLLIHQSSINAARWQYVPAMTVGFGFSQIIQPQLCARYQLQQRLCRRIPYRPNLVNGEFLIKGIVGMSLSHEPTYPVDVSNPLILI